MKFVLSLLLSFTIAFGFSQGLEESFSASCDCWTITNHFDNGQVSSEHHENKLCQKHGGATQYNANGAVIRQENWNNGKLKGKAIAFHHDGSPYLESNYDNGIKIGTWTFLDIEGIPTQEITYTGVSGDATYSHYYNGVKYIEQTVVNGQMVSSNILNQELFSIVQEEASATEKP